MIFSKTTHSYIDDLFYPNLLPLTLPRDKMKENQVFFMEYQALYWASKIPQLPPQ